VQWFRAGDKIDKTERVKSLKSGNAFKLDIKPVEAGDAGVYTAKIVKDKKAVAKAVATLSIEQ